MPNIFKTLKTNQLFDILEEERDEAFENEEFFQGLKDLQHLSKNWDLKKKTQFVGRVLSSFEGVAGWFHISCDGWDTIFGLAGEKHKRKLEGLKLISKTFSDIDEPVTQRLRYIISEAERIKLRRLHPIYNLNQTPKIIFKDFGFKLAVINQLMYKEKILRPSFNIALFAEEYIDKETGYGISIEWYRASQEAARYLWNLDIPEYLLNNITTLDLDQDAEIYRGVAYPGEYVNPKYLNDGYKCIRDDAIEDLALLPNLESIYLRGSIEFEWGKDEDYRNDLSTNFVQALKAKGIELRHNNGDIICRRSD
ncbi:hypothetical protein E4T80_12535 [Muribacter muris]|uniref:DUF6892 domain-containing protein n=1 Tax=Muribacter muris TaxID=67855 RepID=A0A4Y9JN52_9PAST|nr:hypothetical protein [Muribacter muris]MBF0786285.1 hypothetical protein [Muribacter muris]MBF0826804.1 hypothetical protein [Muribacter muris]TFV07214.1 hypothetical protein E4T80_12535 [Muribacter muris]